MEEGIRPQALASLHKSKISASGYFPLALIALEFH